MRGIILLLFLVGLIDFITGSLLLPYNASFAMVIYIIAGFIWGIATRDFVTEVNNV